MFAPYLSGYQITVALFIQQECAFCRNERAKTHYENTIDNSVPKCYFRNSGTVGHSHVTFLGLGPVRPRHQNENFAEVKP
jgi:hypothetical protein